jgi:hypothetical protein
VSGVLEDRATHGRSSICRLAPLGWGTFLMSIFS